MNSIRSLAPVSFICAFVIAVALPAAAQDVVPAPESRPSPLALAQATLHDGTYVKVHYGSPRKRGRNVFGALVPYDKVWRLGANEATELTTTQPIRFGGKPLPAGTYSLFAIPHEGSWTVIVNENLGQWGAFSYSQDADVLRIDAPVQRTEQIHEAFTINLEQDEGESGARLVMTWDQTRVTVPIEAVGS